MQLTTTVHASASTPATRPAPLSRARKPLSLRGLVQAGAVLTMLSAVLPTTMAAPVAPPVKSTRMDAQTPNAASMVYSGGYDLTYSVVSGSVEVCSSIRMYSYCAPVALTIPMEDGVVTTDSLITAFEDYKAAIHSLRLPEALLVQLDTAVEGTLLPALAEELNAGFVALPVEFTMQQSRAVPSSFTADFVGGDGTTYYGVGELNVQTGAYTMHPDYVQGQINASDLTGTGAAVVPVTVQESVEFTTPWGVETLTVSAHGNLGAAYVMDRQ